MSHHTCLSRAILRHLGCVAALLVASASAQAVPVDVVIDGLPGGLAPVVNVYRNLCTTLADNWVPNPPQPLGATTWVVNETVPLPNGQATVVTKTVTRYSASFDTQATPASPTEVSCSSRGGFDKFKFVLQLKGFDSSGSTVSVYRVLGETSQTAPLSVRAAMSARSTFSLPRPATLNRNQYLGIGVHFESSIGLVRGQRLELLRPVWTSLTEYIYAPVAAMFLRTDGAACLQVASLVQCRSAESPVVKAGGILFHGVGHSPGKLTFQMEFTSGFPVGKLRLRASADAQDLDRYVVNGMPTALDLLPWQSDEQDVTVQ